MVLEEVVQEPAQGVLIARRAAHAQGAYVSSAFAHPLPPRARIICPFTAPTPPAAAAFTFAAFRRRSAIGRPSAIRRALAIGRPSAIRRLLTIALVLSFLPLAVLSASPPPPAALGLFLPLARLRLACTVRVLERGIDGGLQLVAGTRWCSVEAAFAPTASPSGTPLCRRGVAAVAHVAHGSWRDAHEPSHEGRGTFQAKT